MAISENGWDAVEEWVYFLFSALGQPDIQINKADWGRRDLRKRMLERLDDIAQPFLAITIRVTLP